MIWAAAYGFLFVCGVTMATFLYCRIKAPGPRIAAAVAAVLIAGVLIERLTHFHYWREYEQPNDKTRIIYTHWLRSDLIDFSYLEFPSEGVQISDKGKLTASRKRHGLWRMSIIHTKPLSFHDEDQYYWYGEPITEGEWHTRNR